MNLINILNINEKDNYMSRLLLAAPHKHQVNIKTTKANFEYHSQMVVNGIALSCFHHTWHRLITFVPCHDYSLIKNPPLLVLLVPQLPFTQSVTVSDTDE